MLPPITWRLPEIHPASGGYRLHARSALGSRHALAHRHHRGPGPIWGHAGGLALEDENIESRPLWKPMHLQPVFAGCEVVGGDVAAALFQHGLCLPSGTAMSETDLERVAAVIQSLRR